MYILPKTFDKNIAGYPTTALPLFLFLKFVRVAFQV